VQLDIANYLQKPPKDRIIVEAFRGAGKSWITVGYVAWTLLLDPQAQIIVVSASEELAKNFVRFLRMLIEQWPLLHHLKPRDGQRTSTLSFDVGPATAKKDPSVVSRGITGQITGGRADRVIFDDVEIPRNSQTQHLRDGLFESVKEAGGAILKPKTECPDGLVLYLGTPQTEDSLYPRLVKEAGYDVRIWPVEIPADPSRYKGRLAPIIQKMIAKGAAPGTPVEPKRFPKEVLDGRRTEYGLKGYTLQFMLDTTLADIDKFPLKVRDLIVHDCTDSMAPVKIVWGNDPRHVVPDLQSAGFSGDRYFYPAFVQPEMANYTGTVMAIDPSGKGDDETSYSIVKFLHGMLFWLDCGGFKDGYGEETLKTLAGKALRWGATDIITETNYGGGMFNSLLQPWLIKVWEMANPLEVARGRSGSAGRILTKEDGWDGWSHTQKEGRILDILEPVFRSHRLVVHRQLILDDLESSMLLGTTKYSVVYQMTRMCRVKGAVAHEDRLESLAMACDFFTARMNRDTDKAHEAYLDSLREKDYRDFLKSAGRLHGSGRPNWTSGSGFSGGSGGRRSWNNEG
jgi:hypothetical protein